MHINWHPSVHGPIVELRAGMEYICVVCVVWKDPDGLTVQPLSLIQSWLSRPLSGICLISAFCLRLSSVPRLKRAASPLFASLLGSEENDNNEAWRLSTTSHTRARAHTHKQTFTLIKRGTQMMLHTLRYCCSTHTQCEMNAGSHKLLFVPHQVCKYMSVVYLQFTAKSSLSIVLLASVLYVIIILLSWFERYSILQKLSLFFV